jgi:hypothetical protein
VPAEPNTSLHRVVQAVRWVASGDWDSFERMHLPEDLHARFRRWLAALVGYVSDLTPRIEHVRALTH